MVHWYYRTDFILIWGQGVLLLPQLLLLLLLKKLLSQLDCNHVP